MAAGNSKKDNLVITDVTSNHGNKLWLHLRILYSICLVIILSLSVTVWLGYRELQRVRHELKHEIHLEARRYVEFNPEFKYSSSNGAQTKFSSSNGEKQRGDNTFGQRLDIKNFDAEDDNIADSAEQEQFLRVKRNARRHGHGKEESSTAHERRNPSYIREPEGSGVEIPEDWVWLTSYSRIPAFALTEFCSATQHYCPPGPPGPQGMPGIQGLKGDKGGVGPIGLKGDQGFRGITGLNGTDGQKGEIGERGLPGMTGERGHRGTKGDKGDEGNQGIPGLPGTKGAKGDMGETGFNGTDGIMGPAGPPGEAGVPGIQGPPGQQGEPGFNGTDGLPGSRGKRGKKGYAGPPGQQGFQGQQGPKGDRGQKGGASGAVPNCTCAPGPPGPPGPYSEGTPGPPGPPGMQGPRGIKGDKGSPGRSNLVLETTRRPVITSTTTTTAPTTIRRSTTPEPVLPPRIKECKIRMVGKPMFQRYTGTWWGTWMTDANPKKPEDANKYWYSRHFTGKLLMEYNNMESFQTDTPSKNYQLDELYFGTGHVIYNGALFYHRAGYSEILKFDLETGKIEGHVLMPDANYQGKENYVYNTEYNYFDLAVDENGLWVIYGSAYNKKHLFVAKLDHKTMKIQKIVTVEVDHQSYGNGFIACGVLYLVKDTKKKTTFIDFEYDLYKEQHSTIRLKFSNPFQMNNMVAYDPKKEQIYCWDKGNQLTYPLLTT